MLGLRGLRMTSMTTQGEAFDSLGFQLLQQRLPTPSPQLIHIINKQISLAQFYNESLESSYLCIYL